MATLPHATGVTCQKTVGNSLFVGCRKTDNILHYDMRDLSEPVLDIYFSRCSTGPYTNQRLYFDLKDTKLLCGNEQGNIVQYDVSTAEFDFAMAAHFDVVTNVAVSGRGLMASGSG